MLALSQKAALTYWGRPRCREVEKKESEGEAEQLQAPGVEGGRPAEHDASRLNSVPSSISGPRQPGAGKTMAAGLEWFQTCPWVSGRVWCREKRHLG